MTALRMPNINQVAISGRLTADADLRFMDNGSARCRRARSSQPELPRPQG